MTHGPLKPLLSHQLKTAGLMEIAIMAYYDNDSGI